MISDTSKTLLKNIIKHTDTHNRVKDSITAEKNIQLVLNLIRIYNDIHMKNSQGNHFGCIAVIHIVMSYSKSCLIRFDCSIKSYGIMHRNIC